MFQSFDNAGEHRPTTRPEWMALLARAPQNLLDGALPASSGAAPQWLRKPETGLMMVQGRAGGTGERFNLGEITVTRCALRLAGADAQAPVGVAYVVGRDHRQAQLAAMADALLQAGHRVVVTGARELAGFDAPVIAMQAELSPGLLQG